MIEKLKSRKLWIAVSSVVAILISDLIGIELSAEKIYSIAGIAASYIGIQGFIDKE